MCDNILFSTPLAFCFMPAVQSTNFPSTVENGEPSFFFQIPSRATAVYVFWGLNFSPKDIKGHDILNEKSIFFSFLFFTFLFVKKTTQEYTQK